jgi:MFS family permease
LGLRGLLLYSPQNLSQSFGFIKLIELFKVANLYYSHPILDILAKDFNVTQERASIIPTCAQGGYAAGLLFICPLGDLIKRRGMVLWLMFFTSTMTLGLCLTKSFDAFVVISFLMSITTVTPVYTPKRTKKNNQMEVMLIFYSKLCYHWSAHLRRRIDVLQLCP